MAPLPELLPRSPCHSSRPPAAAECCQPRSASASPASDRLAVAKILAAQFAALIAPADADSATRAAEAVAGSLTAARGQRAQGRGQGYGTSCAGHLFFPLPFPFSLCPSLCPLPSGRLSSALCPLPCPLPSALCPLPSEWRPAYGMRLELAGCEPSVVNGSGNTTGRRWHRRFRPFVHDDLGGSFRSRQSRFEIPPQSPGPARPALVFESSSAIGASDGDANDHDGRVVVWRESTAVLVDRADDGIGDSACREIAVRRSRPR